MRRCMRRPAGTPPARGARLAQVEAGAKGAARAAEDDHAGRAIGGERREEILELVDHHGSRGR